MRITKLQGVGVVLSIVGFRAVVPWATLSWPKRAFVVFCVVVSLLVVGFGVITILNLYVDTLVSVTLDPLGPTVTKIGENVTAEGKWIRSGSTEGSALGNPLQTSRIECNKEKRRCIEARAFCDRVAAEIMCRRLGCCSDRTRMVCICRKTSRREGGSGR